MLGHGMAVQAIRGRDAGARLGVTLNLYPVRPASEAGGDLDAARRIDGLANRLFLDPMLRGSYPADVVGDLAAVSDFGHVRAGDLDTISAPVDLVGVNYYSGHTVAAPDPDHPAEPYWRAARNWPGSADVRFVTRGAPVTAMGWEVDPGGLTEVLERLHRDYPGVDLYVNENGAAYVDEVEPDGTVHDPDRVAYIDAHLRACLGAIAAGVPLRGYFAWSLLDNFEWSHGYSKRFGLVYVDYPTQRRVTKTSGRRYFEVIKRNGLAE
jgi:beta-glucosidase